jgi:hypothetical protein
MNCYEYSARDLECEQPYAPDADEVFRAQWLQYRQLKQVSLRHDLYVCLQMHGPLMRIYLCSSKRRWQMRMRC